MLMELLRQLATQHYASGEDFEKTLKCYCGLYNHHIPQKALHHQPSITAMKDWQANRPDLFHKWIINHPGPDMIKYDVFISHASEDKDDVARPLATCLDEVANLVVWYDEFSLSVSDSLSEKIDYGLANSRYGVVVISPEFINKKWPKKELRGLNAVNVEGKNKIIPIWHQVTIDDVLALSPTLADIVALNTRDGIEYICKIISQKIVPLATTVDSLIAEAQGLIEKGKYDLSVMAASRALREILEILAYKRLTAQYFKKRGINRYSLSELLDRLHATGGIVPRDAGALIDRKKLNSLRNIAVHGSKKRRISFKDADRFLKDVRLIRSSNDI
ncbi:toll/interleukin-1 receptor domain-containing protein [Halomonas chromatireducens]|uniref:TIR domain-containing protein n=1 Tax=Halomonas chromatireducens TaxID=507626 RepID=A0A0X8HFP3_9GAMM|nr:toll/interleukin-1 receptor domain-containing protein [Halomonas chromatireducens]AMD01783.1 hypothetical protein LOKO_02730 [Halomonas chromatireducens]